MIAFLYDALGFDTFTWTQLINMILRGVFVYFFGIIVLRLNKKLFSVHTPFNFILFVTLGSILAEAIVQEEFFLAILITMFLLILLNRLIDLLMFYVPSIEHVLKGKITILIENGEIQWDNMREQAITQTELLHELHTNLHINDVKKVACAYITTEGTINFIEKK